MGPARTGYPARVRDRPPTSAVSLFTAIGTTLILAVGVVGLALRHAALGYWLLWCVALVAGVAVNAWAYFITRGGR
ncbi:hypothetical protein ORV05_17360 [Amycolatopsis cynarae]|uniref:DUF2530 domain-containing protein n=1 Tax=Amycolatopsis cynarae TaxID=2995223 RepID=A0ABY7BAS6_9PSEU|nr:hypothetical protein [Amycolatopsis sp. HUAS 11-8]WAL69461.1 hypothetical protein ORV05_17360 [Amycolatopsis sp. HUAS 11-8]